MKKKQIAVIADSIVYAEGLRKIIEDKLLDPEIMVHISVEDFWNRSTSNDLPGYIFLFTNGPFKNINSDVLLIKQISKSIKLILLCSKKCLIYFKRLKIGGISGFIDFEDSVLNINKGIECILSGKYFISDSLFESIFQEGFIKESINPFDKLTDLEFIVAEELYNNNNVEDVAKDLNQNYKSIISFKYRIYKKLELKNDENEYRNLVNLYSPFIYQNQ